MVRAFGGNTSLADFMLFAAFGRICEFFTALLQAALIRPPLPQQILRQAPPRCMLGECKAGLNVKHNLVAASLRDALIATVRRQLASGTQCGVAVCVYWHGQPLAHVCGGGMVKVNNVTDMTVALPHAHAKTNTVFRDAASGWLAQWRPVQRDTLFMGYSVVKGVAATCLMACVDNGEVAYDQVSGMMRSNGCWSPKLSS